MTTYSVDAKTFEEVKAYVQEKKDQMEARAKETREEMLKRHEAELKELDKRVRAADKNVRMCVATIHDGPDYPYPIECTFPPGLERAEQDRIKGALVETVKQLGYKPSWIPII